MPNKPLQPSAKSAGLAAGARPRMASRIKERPGFLSRCLASFLFRSPPSDDAGVQSNRVVVRTQPWQRSSPQVGGGLARSHSPAGSPPEGPCCTLCTLCTKGARGIRTPCEPLRNIFDEEELEPSVTTCLLYTSPSP